MPAQKNVQGVARVSVRGTANGVQCVNVFHVRNGLSTGAGYTVAGVSALGNSINTLYNSHFRTKLNTDWSGDDIVVQDLSSIIAPGVTLAQTGNGSVAGSSVPASVAICISWKIARHYRGGHPRTYLGPLGSGAIETPTSFVGTFITSVQTSASSFLTGVNALTIEGVPQQLVCVHRQLAGEVLDIPQISPITACVVDSRIDTMRRRLGKDR